MDQPGWTEETWNGHYPNGPPFRTPRRPHAFIQWKGTDVCMDVYCPCGDQFHIDSDFAHFTQCRSCGRVFQSDWHVRLKEVRLEDAYIEPKVDDEQLEVG